MITATQAPEKYLELFQQFDSRNNAQPKWLNKLRQEAFDRFAEAGFPTTHDEDWRFTSVAPIANTPFEFADGKVAVSEDQIAHLDTAVFACRLVFINGRFSRELSRLPRSAQGVHVGSLSEALQNHAEAVGKHLGKYLNTERDAFAALNTAFIEDGTHVFVPRGAALEQPIYALFLTVPGGTAVMDHPRNLIVVEESGHATVVEDYVALGSGASFSNSVTELVAGDNANVAHYMIVREGNEGNNVSTLRIQQGRNANVATHSLLLSGALVRNNVHPVLDGEGAECLINGLFMANGRQHMDNYMLVEHAKAHCDSRQFYNGILNGQAHGVFHGRIIVHKDAQKTDAKQTNRNLLLSDDAQIDTKPQLEIYADDVKCTHGATIGQVDDNALFYLRSRGLDEPSARHALLLAFANECLDRMNSKEVRDHVQRLVVECLPESARISGERMEITERRWEEKG